MEVPTDPATTASGGRGDQTTKIGPGRSCRPAFRRWMVASDANRWRRGRSRPGRLLLGGDGDQGGLARPVEAAFEGGGATTATSVVGGVEAAVEGGGATTATSVVGGVEAAVEGAETTTATSVVGGVEPPSRHRTTIALGARGRARAVRQPGAVTGQGSRRR